MNTHHFLNNLSGGAMLVNYNGVETLYYGYTDNQGSLIALTNESGSVVEKYAYDPWGARRDPANWQSKDTRTSFITNRGYTGHEHLDAFGIINMNGRVYDPLTTLFFSPDPFVQAPGNWLNFNRYGYCMNNPTKYTDPSGYKLADKNSVWFAEGYLNWMGYSGGGGGGGSSYFETSAAWNAQGSISYNYENQSYEYASGNKATEQEAMNMYARPSNSHTYYGQNASTVYRSLRDGDSYTTNALNNIGLSAKANVAAIEKGAVEAWNGMVGALVIQSNTTFTAILEEYLASSKFTTSLTFISSKANVFLFVLTFEGDTGHNVERFNTERGYPQNNKMDPVIQGFQNDKFYQGNKPPKWMLIPIIGAIIYDVYNNWPKPNLSAPTNSIQPIYQQQQNHYDQYFMNFK